MAYGTLVGPGMELPSPALEAQSLNHWITRKVPTFFDSPEKGRAALLMGVGVRPQLGHHPLTLLTGSPGWSERKCPNDKLIPLLGCRLFEPVIKMAQGSGAASQRSPITSISCLNNPGPFCDPLSPMPFCSLTPTHLQAPPPSRKLSQTPGVSCPHPVLPRSLLQHGALTSQGL